MTRSLTAADSPALRFQSVMRIRGVNPYLLVSAARARVIRPAWRKPMPVRVRINGKPARAWRINMMPVGNGSFYLYLHAEVRKASGTSVGDRVEAEVSFDPEYRNGPMQPIPRWFAAALRAQPAAQKSWKALPPSRKKEVVRYLLRLKSLATRARNLERAMRVLGGANERFMGREWRDGA